MKMEKRRNSMGQWIILMNKLSRFEGQMRDGLEMRFGVRFVASPLREL